MAKPGYTAAKILVTVKTYPTPSQNHVETVCVAGVRMDTAFPEWVRLYPIPFRTLGDKDQFRKWQLVDADIRPRGSSDPRPESYSPDVGSLELGSVIDSHNNWERRRRFIEPLIGDTTTCELVKINKATRMNMPAPSLGLIKPTISEIEWLDPVPWTKNQLAKAKKAAEPDLFNTPLKELQPPGARLRFHYHCQEPGCRGHKAELIDWELGAAALRWERQYGSDLESRIMEKWTDITGPTKDIYFFIGNQHQHRNSFSILGLWYPKLG